MRYLIGLLWLALVIWALVDLFKSNRSTEQKIIWLIVILVFPVAATIIYYLVSRKVI